VNVTIDGVAMKIAVASSALQTQNTT